MLLILAAASWRPELRDGMNGLFHLDYANQDEIFRINNSGLNPISESDSFSFLNARIGIEKDNWGAYFTGRNLTDDQGAANPIAPGQVTTIAPVRPRMFGVEFRAGF